MGSGDYPNNFYFYLPRMCNHCFPRVEKGVAPACVAQCTGRAMHVGYLDDAVSSVHKLVKVWKVALPLYPDRGTEPNVYYVPPFLGPMVEDHKGNLRTESKVPTKLLEEMFGRGVDRALSVLRQEREKRVAMQPSELMDILIGRRSSDMMLNPLT